MFLDLKNTVIGYKAPLIHGADASLNLGEVGLLIGNNGVGKTTLIKSILNQNPLLNGEILLDGKVIRNLSAKQIAEQIAVVFSKSYLPSHFTVTDLISLGKYIHYPYYFEISEQDKNEVSQIIDSLDLTQYKHLTINKLSDGNLQKAFIGRALAQNVPFIILDEPTAHLDEENKIMILQLLRKLAKDFGKLILYSSHDWRLAKEFADKIWYIKDQKLYTGIAEDVISGHEELSLPRLFNINSEFVPPQIIAPDLQKELLFSFLQKNFREDLGNLQFTFSEGFWSVSGVKKQQTAQNFEEILQILAKPR